MEKIYNYFYKITNLINNKYYFGVHKTNNLNDNYMGSGLRIKYAYSKYGIENFKKDIIKFFNTYEDALIYESEIVNENLVENNNCYNIAIGGRFNNMDYSNVIDKKTNKCIRVKRNSKYFKNKNNYFFINKDKVSVQDISGNTMQIDINNENYINGNLKFIGLNKVIVKDSKNNYYQVDKTDERYVNGDLKHVWVNRKHTPETIEKMKTTHKLNKHQIGDKNSCFGTVWVYNLDLKENKKIKNNSLDLYLNDGWVKGRKMKF